jgi:RNA polymerase sigma factor (TIGR02999 family)
VLVVSPADEKRNVVFFIKEGIISIISPVTHILEAVQSGDAKAAAELLPLVYEELRKLAASKMANEAAGNTLQPTALVHEAWQRLVGDENPKFAGRPHFFAAAAEAMRRILIDRARSKRALRHGGGQQRVNIDQIDVASPDADDQLLAMNDALEKLAAQDPTAAQLVKLRYFAGLTVEEAAGMLDIAPRTARNYWAYARTWLYHEITTRDH